MQPLALADSDGEELRFHEDISTNMLVMAFFCTPSNFTGKLIAHLMPVISTNTCTQSMYRCQNIFTYHVRAELAAGEPAATAQCLVQSQVPTGVQSRARRLVPRLLWACLIRHFDGA